MMSKRECPMADEMRVDEECPMADKMKMKKVDEECPMARKKRCPGEVLDSKEQQQLLDKIKERQRKIRAGIRIPLSDVGTSPQLNGTCFRSRKHYIGAALRSPVQNEVYVFVRCLFYIIRYDPAAPQRDRLVRGPVYLTDCFPGLLDSQFQARGFRAAFSTANGEAFIFSQSVASKIKLPSVSQRGNKVILHKGKVMIKPTSVYVEVFSCLGGTGFDASIDAAFESSSNEHEAFLLKGRYYAVINYDEDKLVTIGVIAEKFPCLKDTPFERSIGAAYASHNAYEVYLFKDNIYAKLNYSPSQSPSLTQGLTELVPNGWPSLRGIVPFDYHRNKELVSNRWVPSPVIFIDGDDGFGP